MGLWDITHIMMGPTACHDSNWWSVKHHFILRIFDWTEKHPRYIKPEEVGYGHVIDVLGYTEKYSW